MFSLDSIRQEILVKSSGLALMGGWLPGRKVFIHYAWAINLYDSFAGEPNLIGIKCNDDGTDNSDTASLKGLLFYGETVQDFRLAKEEKREPSFIPPMIELEQDNIAKCLNDFPLFTSGFESPYMLRDGDGIVFKIHVASLTMTAGIFIAGDLVVEQHKAFWTEVTRAYKHYLSAYQQQGIYLDESLY